MAKRRPIFGGRRTPMGSRRAAPTARQRRQLVSALADAAGRIVNVAPQALETIWGWISNGGTREPTRRDIETAAESLVPAEIVPDGPEVAEGSTRPRSRPSRDTNSIDVEPVAIGYTFFAPNSTNVYSYRYDDQNHELYVTFRPKEKLQRGSDQRANQAGYTYKYFNVPVDIWNRFRANAQADHRGGEEVWDELRRRGSIFGTKFAYSLVDAHEVNGATYVPRRATAKGFKKRSVVDVRSSRRGQPIWIENTLPEQNGFGSRRNGRQRRK